MVELPLLASHKSSCNCTGCGVLRAGVCINCAEKIAMVILQSGSEELAVEPCSGACREAIELYFSTPPERWRAQLDANVRPRQSLAEVMRLPGIALGETAGALGGLSRWRGRRGERQRA